MLALLYNFQDEVVPHHVRNPAMIGELVRSTAAKVYSERSTTGVEPSSDDDIRMTTLSLSTSLHFLP